LTFSTIVVLDKYCSKKTIEISKGSYTIDQTRVGEEVQQRCVHSGVTPSSRVTFQCTLNGTWQIVDSRECLTEKGVHGIINEISEVRNE